MLAGLALALLAGASVSWTLPKTLVIQDERGTPAAGAYVRYHYRGSFPNFVHPVSYVASGSVIARADDSGRVTIPFRVHVRSPLPVSMPPAAFIDHVYAPSAHNAFGPITRLSKGRPGVFSIDWEAGRLLVGDVSADAERWELSLRELYELVRALAEGETAADDEDRASLEHGRELVGRLRREFAELLSTHGGSPRRRPAAPVGQSDAERLPWAVEVDAHLAREPLWGPYLQRMWRDELKELSRLDDLYAQRLQR